jgi:hypothetical protein
MRFRWTPVLSPLYSFSLYTLKNVYQIKNRVFLAIETATPTDQISLLYMSSTKSVGVVDKIGVAAKQSRALCVHTIKHPSPSPYDCPDHWMEKALGRRLDHGQHVVKGIKSFLLRVFTYPDHAAKRCPLIFL